MCLHQGRSGAGSSHAPRLPRLIQRESQVSDHRKGDGEITISLASTNNYVTGPPWTRTTHSAHLLLHEYRWETRRSAGARVRASARRGARLFARCFQLSFQIENLRARLRGWINPKRALKMVKSWMVPASRLCRTLADRTRTRRAARLCDQSPQLFWAGRRPSQEIPPWRCQTRPHQNADYPVARAVSPRQLNPRRGDSSVQSRLRWRSLVFRYVR